MWFISSLHRWAITTAYSTYFDSTEIIVETYHCFAQNFLKNVTFWFWICEFDGDWFSWGLVGFFLVVVCCCALLVW